MCRPKGWISVHFAKINSTLIGTVELFSFLQFYVDFELLSARKVIEFESSQVLLLQRLSNFGLALT